MGTRRRSALALVLLTLLSTGCVGQVRETTTARTSTEILLISSAAERAVIEYDVQPLAGKRVFVDTSYFTAVDKEYVVSALRSHLAANGVILAKAPEPASETNLTGTDLVLEIRNGTLGLWDGDFVLGIPEIPVAVPGFPPAMLPPLYLFRRLSQQGYAKFQLWVYDAATQRFFSRSGDLWGRSYYNQWWLFGIGPFVGSDDVYPPDEIFRDWLWGTNEDLDEDEQEAKAEQEALEEAEKALDEAEEDD